MTVTDDVKASETKEAYKVATKIDELMDKAIKIEMMGSAQRR